MSSTSDVGPKTQTMPAGSPARPSGSAQPGGGPQTFPQTFPTATPPAAAAQGNGSPARQSPVPVSQPPGGKQSTGKQVQAGKQVHRGPRRVRLVVSRVDPWSVMKMGFLLSVAVGIAGVIMTAMLWTILNSMGIFDSIDQIVRDQLLASSDTHFYVLDYVGFRRVVSVSIVIGVIDVVLVTAIATLGAFLYNISSSLVGGVQLTLTDD